MQAQLERWKLFLGKWEIALQEDKEVIVALDANIDHLTWRQPNLPSYSSSVRLKPLIDELFTKIIPYGVSQIVKGATRIERGSPQTGLDHVYTNKIEKLSSVQTYLTGTSDHKLLKFVRFTKAIKHLPRYIQKRSFKDFDDETFVTNISNCGLEEILQYNDVEAAADILTRKINNVLDKMAPIKKFQTRKNYVPWLKKETKMLKDERDSLHKKAVISDDPNDWRQFRAIRNKVTTKMRQDKRDWERDKLELEKNSSTGVWQAVKSWLGWGTAGTPTQLFFEGHLISSPSQLASTMNKFFLEKIQNLRNNIPVTSGDPLKKFREAMEGRNCNFSVKMVEEVEVQKIIKGLKNSSATGIDYIDTRTLKLIADYVSVPLAHIINLSISSGIFPKVWKWAKVVPLLKSNTADATLPKSYRPVALLPIMSKILERVVFGQLVKYLEDNKLIHPNLHGSRKGHDTSTALLQLYDMWIEDIEEGKTVGVLICDQSAAFDLCDHQILLGKLKLMGLDDSALNWIESYLGNRKQSCFVDAELSIPLNLPACGVPQGSVGGPLLWLAFTCDQPDVVHDHPVTHSDLHRGCPAKKYPNVEEKNCGELVGYVDDGAYSFAHRDPAIVSTVLTEKYDKLEDWMNTNKLVINADKTHLLVMSNKKYDNHHRNISIMAGNYQIKPSTSEKLLGGHIHKSLRWNYHIAECSSSLVKQLVIRNNALKRVSRNANFGVRLMIANGSVQSKLIYLINVWGGAQQYLLKALQLQQLTAARTVCGPQSMRWSKSRLLQKVRWLSVKQLIEFHTILQAHKTLITGKPVALFDELSGSYPYQTRSATVGDIRLKKENSSLRTFKYRAMVLYNRVPQNVKTGSLLSFKHKLKQWIKENVPLDWS